jgi:hypothetical protein
MGVLLITCPRTGKEFSTGIQADRETAGGLPKVSMQSRCPFCQTDHSWNAQDARYVDAIPPSDWIERQP